MQPSLGQTVLYNFNSGGQLVQRPAIVTKTYPAPALAVDLTVFFAAGDQPNNVMLGYPSGVPHWVEGQAKEGTYQPLVLPGEQLVHFDKKSLPQGGSSGGRVEYKFKGKAKTTIKKPAKKKK